MTLKVKITLVEERVKVVQVSLLYLNDGDHDMSDV